MSNLTSVAYLISSVLFILSLRGLSHPTTARRGNFYGIVGMAIAISTKLPRGIFPKVPIPKALGL